MVAKKTSKVESKASAEKTKKRARYLAKVALSPSVGAAAVIEEYGKLYGPQDISLLVEELRSRMDQIKAGNLHHCEAMLLGQAEALQNIFVSLARRANSQEYLKQYETYLRLALKAQSQSRMTLETLAAIKNPPVVFARQANINQGGNQQVNNGAPAPDTHAQKTVSQPNELLEAQHGSETLDARTAGTTIGGNPAMATLG